jgi:hypothetical protein
MNIFRAFLLVACAGLLFSACDDKKPQASAADLDKAKTRETPATPVPAEHFNGKDGPAATGGPPTPTSNGQ